MENITFQYPLYYLFLCLGLGLLYAAFVYFRTGNKYDWNQSTSALLAFLRFTGITLLASLLLSPLLKTLSSEAKNPVVVIAADGSESIGIALGEQKTQFNASLNQLSNELSTDYEVKTFTFGSTVKEGLDTSYSQKVTNMSAMLKEVYDRFSNQNLGAVFLVSDGIYNEGSNPVYFGGKLQAPIYTVAVGDTTPKKDVILKRVLHNNIAYLNDEFSIQVDVSAANLSGAGTRLEVGAVQNGQFNKIGEKNIAINKGDYFKTFDFILPANAAGVQRFRARLTGLAGEASRVNNSKDFFVDVLDARQQILILAHAPHPDLTALRQELGNNKNYEVDIHYAESPPTELNKYSFAILHQLPSNKYPISGVVNQLDRLKIPRWYIWGESNKRNNPNPLFKYNAKSGNPNEVTANAVSSFTYFNLSDELKTLIPKFPPLLSPFGDYGKTTTGQTLLNQKIGSVSTDYPLMVIGEQDGIKTGILAGEGLWKWRLFDFLQNDEHQLFGELVSKIVQYLSTKEDKRRFRVSVAKNIFKENESIDLSAELYNNNYELINGPEATVVVKDESNKEYKYTFSKTANAYLLDIGTLPVGNYRYTANTSFTGEQFSVNGQFSVQPIQLELFNTTADHNLLNVLSRENGGKTLYPNELSSITQMLKEEQNLTPVIYTSSLTQSVINFKWICALLLLIFAAEWFIRRYKGSY